jgi:hypothetical protein
MSEAHFNMSKAGKDRYRLAFETEGAKAICEVSVRRPGGRDHRSEDEKRVAALHAAKRLVRAFHEGIPAE